ncbi:hypothetical protein K3495_g17382, partial [Podosphaera aphanis]
MRDYSDDMLCYKCDGCDHVARNCPYSDEVKAFGVALRKKHERQKFKRRTMKKPKKLLSKDEKKPKGKRSLKPKKSHGYTACEESDNDTESSSEEDIWERSASDSDHPPTQKVMLTKALISKSTPNYWVLDTGATSPMTDQIHLFR